MRSPYAPRMQLLTVTNDASRSGRGASINWLRATIWARPLDQIVPNSSRVLKEA